MVSAMTAFGERLLNAVLPQATAEAADTCWWETQCKHCVTMPPGPHAAHRSRSRLCCTSQDGSYCNAYGSWNTCTVKSYC